jgi:hypothetical protein
VARRVEKQILATSSVSIFDAALTLLSDGRTVNASAGQALASQTVNTPGHPEAGTGWKAFKVRSFFACLHCESNQGLNRG